MATATDTGVFWLDTGVRSWSVLVVLFVVKMSHDRFLFTTNALRIVGRGNKSHNQKEI